MVELVILLSRACFNASLAGSFVGFVRMVGFWDWLYDVYEIRWIGSEHNRIA